MYSALKGIEDRTAELQTAISALSKDVVHDEAARKKLMAIVFGLLAQNEQPEETVWRILMQFHQNCAIRIALEMGLFAKLAPSKEPMTANELSRELNVPKLMLVRIMRPLVCLGMVAEVDVETYAPLPIAQALTGSALVGGFKFIFDECGLSLAKMPEYLASKGFANVEGAPGPYQHARDTELGLFPWLMAHPKQFTNFNAFMGGQRANRVEWFESFPAQELVLEAFKLDDPESVLFVDIAGGWGHDTDAFAKRFSDAPGKIILQDLPDTIDQIPQMNPGLDGRVVRMKHDFFTEQPVKGARAYYFRSIFHDWPDHDCIKIMKRTAAAMQKGYSKLLIFEWILPMKATPMYPALLDINMMALLNGMERTEYQWTQLLDAAGLRVVKFHKLAEDTEGMVEAELK